MTLVALAALALPAFVACAGETDSTTTASSSVPPRDIPACNEVYAPEKKITRAEFGEACVTEKGDLITPLPVRIRCEDDRMLYWNDLAWGYLDGPMTMTPEDRDVKIPDALDDECLNTEAPAT